MSENEEQQIKKEKVRKAEWRYNEDGTYNNKPISNTYFRDYYREKIACKVECVLCGRMVGKQKIHLHKLTNLCTRYSEYKKSSNSSSSDSQNC